MKVNCKELLSILKVSAIGLTNREILEQSNTFVFKDKELITFNGEISTRHENPLDFDAVIPAEDLIKILMKFPDEEIDINKEREEVVFKGKRKSAGILCFSEVHLPFDTIPIPKKWKSINKETNEMFIQAARTCGKDETQKQSTEVHVTPHRIEACDNFRIFRVEMETGFSEEIMIPASSIHALKDISLIKSSIGEGWIHFKTDTNHQISLRCDYTKYIDLDPILEIKEYQEVTLPDNLGDIIERAEVMNEGDYDSRIEVNIEEGHLTIKSQKETGWYKERKRIKYSGIPLKFNIHPKFFTEVLQKTHSVMIGNNKLKFKMNDIIFMVCLEMN